MLFGALGVLLALPACSGGDGGADTAGGTGSDAAGPWYSCHVPDEFLCQENNGSPFGDCAAGGGIAGDGCPTDDLYGICRVAQADASYQQNVYTYDGWETTGRDSPEEECALLGGRWE
jgi:hypothetical protein